MSPCSPGRFCPNGLKNLPAGTFLSPVFRAPGGNNVLEMNSLRSPFKERHPKCSIELGGLSTPISRSIPGDCRRFRHG
jgi:hypothetical protein